MQCPAKGGSHITSFFGMKMSFVRFRILDALMRILDSFRVFLRLEISENFSYDDRVIEVSVIEVYIGKGGS